MRQGSNFFIIITNLSSLIIPVQLRLFAELDIRGQQPAEQGEAQKVLFGHCSEAT